MVRYAAGVGSTVFLRSRSSTSAAVARGFGVPLLTTLPPAGLVRLSVMNSGRSMFEIAPREDYCVRVRRLTEQLLLVPSGREAEAEKDSVASGAFDSLRRLFGFAGR